MTERLSRTEWITAALRVLASDGVSAVRVEKLAAALKVTKGSFYWHFKDREALLDAVLEAWKARATEDVITAVERGGGDARKRLTALGRIVFADNGALDMQIRAWAANDARARQALGSVDRRRLDYLEAILAEFGLGKTATAARARFVYLALIGQFSAGGDLRLTTRQLDEIIAVVAAA